jgi:hypothetical protein
MFFERVTNCPDVRSTTVEGGIRDGPTDVVGTPVDAKGFEALESVEVLGGDRRAEAAPVPDEAHAAVTDASRTTKRRAGNRR